MMNADTLGGGGKVGLQGLGTTHPGTLDEHDLVIDIFGNNRRQMPNQRWIHPRSLDADNQPSDSPVERIRRHYYVSISRTIVVIALASGFLTAGGARSQPAVPACAGNKVTVERGDTLSRIAERCDVSEGAILSANPTIDGSGDLNVGEKINLSRTDRSGSGVSERLNNFATEANAMLGRVASRVGSSAQDLLDKNPDLKSRLEDVGRKIGLDGSTSAR